MKTTLQNIIKELEFDWVNPNIEKEFTLEPIRGGAVVWCPEKAVTTRYVEKYAQDNGLVVANLTELLDYAAKEWNSQDIVVALGSSAVVFGGRGVPCLYGLGAGRFLNLRWYGPRLRRRLPVPPPQASP
jgi:hypothetical protein